MKTKKQKIIDSVLNEAKRLSREPLTAKQQNALKTFIEKRLDIHGKYGYMFQIAAFYKKQLIAVDDIKRIATYTLDNNHIKTIANLK